MSTVPASKYVNIIPNVLNAGGAALQLLGIQITGDYRIPSGQVLSFASASAVGAFFGLNSGQAASASVYFAGFDNKSAIPAAMLFARWPGGGLRASLQSGNVTSLGLPAIQAMSGSLTVVMDGYTYTNASFSLASATSFTAAATLIATALTASIPTQCSFTGSIAAETASITAGISGTVMTVTAIASGILVPGSVLSGTGVSAGTQITAQLSGTPQGLGTYAVSILQGVQVGTTISTTYGLLTAGAPGSGTLSVGQSILGSGVTANTELTGYGTGSGLAGTYYVNKTQTVGSEALTSTGATITVTFDSISGSFFIKSGITGAASSAAFATGTLAASLLFTSATGAILSQGVDPQTPAAFMSGITNYTQNWATFWTDFDPDDGVGNGQKLAFAEWVNSTQNRYCYICWDPDITPTESTNAASSLGQLLMANDSSGTLLIWETAETTFNHAAFVAGMAASVNYEAANGQIDLTFKHQQGLTASVTNLTTATNLDANGYNYYVASSTANQGFVFFSEGQISGPFQWANTYLNQIWLNASLQLALLDFLTIINAVPYNAAGYAQVEAACFTVIQQALFNGVIVPGIPLSSSQIVEINTAAGANVAGTVSTQGYYFQVQPATPQTRQARTSPVIYFWYTDGGAIQQIVVNSVDVE